MRRGGYTCWARAFFALLMTLPAPAALAEDGAPALAVALNRLQQDRAACRVTFVLENTLQAGLTSLVFETVLLSKDDAVMELTLFDMGALPEGAARVRIFDLPQMRCDAIGRVLINGVAACDGGGLAPADCEAALQLSSRLEVGLQ